MKLSYYTFFLLLFLLFIACSEDKKTTFNHFSSASDTLIVKTKKQKGDGFFQIGATTFPFKKVTSEFPYKIKYPKDIDSIERTLFMPNFKEKKDFYIDIIKGYSNEKMVFIVDDNNNKDLTDDSVRPMETMDWTSSKKLIKCYYNSSEGTEIVEDFSWLKIGTSKKNILIGRSDHVSGTFTIASKTYTIIAADPMNLSFTYNIHPQLAVIKNQEVELDTITNSDILKLGEFIKLENTYYKFDHISENGKFIRLIKEEEFHTKVGTQVGMIAPDFTVVTTNKDTIRSENLHHKTTLIANSCGCGGDKKSTQAFYDIQAAFQNINILHIDSNIKKTDNGWHIDMKNDFNKDFYNAYRKQYCLRVCFVIDKDNRITNKFLITDWKTALANSLE
ncbi:peroxiredoxin family protein [Kordia sp.]|uniref:peroxiredoxin family protein n=1 Tax=Kordia sp. TaxID=1965332 RepID=UPI003B5A7111